MVANPKHNPQFIVNLYYLWFDEVKILLYSKNVSKTAAKIQGNNFKSAINNVVLYYYENH